MKRDQGIFEKAALREDVDLDIERRKEILSLESRLDTMTHWEALGIAWNSTSAEARAAYVDRAKVYHPDRYPGKALGSYLPRLERIFRRLTEARDALGDERQRAEYARRTATPEQFAVMEARRLDEQRRVDERRSRLARQSPLFGRAARIRELLERGKLALREGRYGQAANDLQVVLSMDKGNVEAASLALEARKKAAAAKAGDLYDKGTEAEVLGQLAQALGLFKEAFEADGTHVRAASSASRTALRMGDLREARALAEAALKAGPRVGLAHEAMALVLESEGSKKEARQLFERAVELDPRLENAKERLKRLRWSFRG